MNSTTSVANGTIFDSRAATRLVGKHSTSPTPVIETQALTKSYDIGARRFEAVSNVDLRVVRGEFLCLTGASGSGKSTLLRLLAGLTPASSGKVSIQGTELAQVSDDERTELRANQIGIVFQRSNLFPTLSVRDNLRLAARIALGDWDAEAERRQWLLETLHIDHLSGQRPNQLSGGEQQRVAIARALVHRPALLLADEPTGSLDSNNTANIIRLLSDLNQTNQQTIFLITHDSWVSKHGSRELEIRDGRIQ